MEQRRDPVAPTFDLLVVVLAFAIPVYRKWVSIVAPLLIVLWLVRPGLRPRLRAMLHDPLVVASLAFIALNMLSATWSSYPAEGLSYAAKYRYLLLVPALATTVGPRLARLTVVSFLAGTGLSLLISFGAAMGFLAVGNLSAANPAPGMAHLDYSLLLAVAGVVLLNRIVYQSARRSRLLHGLLLVAVVAGLLVNIGRSGQLAFVVAVLVMGPVWAASRLGSRRAVVAASGAVLAVVALAYAAVPRFGHGIDSGLSELSASVHGARYDTNVGKRVAGAVVAGDLFQRRPFLGTGVGGAMPAFRELVVDRYPDLSGDVYWFPHLHSQYLQVGVELGILGLALLATLLVSLGRRRDPDAERRHLGLAISLVYALGFVADPFLHKQLPLVAFSLFAGLLAAPVCRVEAEEHREDHAREG